MHHIIKVIYMFHKSLIKLFLKYERTHGNIECTALQQATISDQTNKYENGGFG